MRDANDNVQRTDNRKVSPDVPGKRATDVSFCIK